MQRSYGGSILLAFLLAFLFLLGITVIAGRLLGKQQRIVRESEGAPDLRRADDAELAPPFDPNSAKQVAEDYYAGGAVSQWRRGVRDEDFDDPTSSRGIPKTPAPATGGQWEFNDQIEHQEGWCPDPFGRHEVRWISNGSPTNLVRDGGVESHDDPPDAGNERT